MFMMVNDGGTPDITASNWDFRQSLLQRALLLEFSQQGLPFALLKGAEYRDSKVMTFVFESRAHTEIIDQGLQDAIKLAHEKLDKQLGFSTPLSVSAVQHPLGWWSSHIPDSDLCRIFLLHAFLVSHVPVELCARKLPLLHLELEQHLQEIILPSLFRGIACSDAVFPNIDGRLFLELLRFVIEMKTTSMKQLFTSLQLTDGLISTFDGPGLANRYPSPSSTVISSSPPLEYRLLPFSNHVFDTALANIHIPVTPEDISSLPRSVFGMQILTQDTKHWHNGRSILPSYLGGQKSEQQLTEWEKKRRLRKEQRDQARLQKQAASLTGASGNVLERIAIPATRGSAKSNPQVRPFLVSF